MAPDRFTLLLKAVRACQACAGALPHGVRPVLQAHPDARVLLVGQAPGRKVHASGIPFDDASGERLRAWLGVDRAVFYDPHQIAILPMGFCYPGTGRSGDLPPRPECAPLWRERLLAGLPGIRLTVVIGHYAQRHHLPGAGPRFTDVVADWARHLPAVFPIPHPSPRNRAWLKRHPWFEQEAVPALQAAVAEALGGAAQAGSNCAARRPLKDA
jgi:uracil-DNA glycosylase